MIFVTKPKLGSFISYGKFSDDRFCHLKKTFNDKLFITGAHLSRKSNVCDKNKCVTKITASLKVLLFGQIDLIELSELHLLL
jgi:hypothetical protein